MYNVRDYDIYMSTEDVGRIAPILPLFLRLHESMSIIDTVLC